MDRKEKESIKQHNMKYLELDAQQYNIHAKIIATNMGQWPKLLKKYLKKEHGKDMFCGDALMCWVADWIKAQEVKNGR